LTPYEKFSSISDSDFNFNENKNRNIKKLFNKLGVSDTSVNEEVYNRSGKYNFSYQIFYEIFLEKQIYNRDLLFFNKEQLLLLKNILRTSSSLETLNQVGFGQINVTKDKSIFYLSEPDIFLETSPEKIRSILNTTIECDPKNQFSEIFIGYPVDNSILNTTIILDKDFSDTPTGDFQTLIETSTTKEFYRYNKYLDINNKNEDTLNLLVKAIRVGMTEEQLTILENEEIDFKERKKLFNNFLSENVLTYINLFCDFRNRNNLIDEIYKDMIKLKNLIINPPSLEKLNILNKLMPETNNATQYKKAMSYYSTIYQVPEFVDIDNYTYIANFQLSKEKLEKLITFIEKFPNGIDDLQNQSITTEQLRILSTPQMSLKSFDAYLQIFINHKSIDTFSVLKYVKPDKQHSVMIQKIIKTLEVQEQKDNKNIQNIQDIKTTTKDDSNPKENETTITEDNNVINNSNDDNDTNKDSINNINTNKTATTPIEMTKPKLITLDDIDDFDDFKDFKFY
jgi:hypothetical protein